MTLLKNILSGAVVLSTIIGTQTVTAFANTHQELSKELAERDYPLSLSGSYLAALTANKGQDHGAAALFYDHALQADPNNVALIERTFLLKLADGDVEGAVSFASNILDHAPKNRFARLALGVVALRERSYKKAAREFNYIKEGPLALLTGTLLHGWTLAGDKKFNEAIALLDKLEGPEWYHAYRLYHSALIADMAGKKNLALEKMNAAYAADKNSLRTAEALTRLLLRYDKIREGNELKALLELQAGNRPNIKVLLNESTDGKKPKGIITSSQEGAMEVLYGLGSAIGREGGEEISLVYLNLAHFLAPKNPLTLLALGNILEDGKLYDKAISIYEKVDDKSPYKNLALLQSAFAYNASDKLDKTRTILDDLIEREPENLLTIGSYGNILRSHELYEEARTIYNKAIEQIDTKPAAQNWQLYYSRGITNERTKRWEEAEKDFRKALKLQPNQPQVLNYLGYSLIDMGLKYEEALEMITKAVELRPDDAFIIDSLGWAYFKLEDYEKAVKHLERAVELRPQDPILNDHLGDAYWHVGRKLEAVFQWSHARDLDPEPKDLEKIVQKIANGFIADNDG